MPTAHKTRHTLKLKHTAQRWTNGASAQQNSAITSVSSNSFFTSHLKVALSLTTVSLFLSIYQKGSDLFHSVSDPAFFGASSLAEHQQHSGLLHLAATDSLSTTGSYILQQPGGRDTPRSPGNQGPSTNKAHQQLLELLTQ